MGKYWVYILATVVAVFVTTTTRAQRNDDRAPEGNACSYVVVLGNDTTFELTDSVFYNISTKVIFPVNKYVIPKNSEFRRRLQEELDVYMSDTSIVLDQVFIRGAASPEGPLPWNKFLANRRAKAITDIITEDRNMHLLEPFKVKLVDEDYFHLLLLLKERGDKEYDIVADLVNRYAGGDQQRLKEKMMQYDGGRLWRRLLRDYFPQMRAARMVLVFRKMKRLEWNALPLELRGEVVPMELEPEPMPEEPAVLPRRELLSVKTNLLFDALATPNLAIEYYPMHGHFTFGASIDFPWWQNYNSHRYWQIRNYQLEARYYFRSGDVRQVGYGRGPAFRGWYLQAYAHAGLYNICFDEDSGYEGEAVGAGIGAGYVMPLGKKGRWRLEFNLQVGYMATWYDPYQWLCPVDPSEDRELYYYKWTGKPEDFKTRQHFFTWLGPTRVGITLTYDLLYRKRTKRGVGLRSWERND